LITNMLRCWS